MTKKKEESFTLKFNDHPDACPKCGGEAEFCDNEESEGEYEIVSICCTECDFAWLEYYRFEKWEPCKEEK